VGARTGDNGCPEDAEEGNVVACDLSRRTHRPQGQLQKRHLRPGRRVLHSVLRLVHVDRHYTPAAKVVRWWRGRGGIEVGQTHASGRNRQRGRRNWTQHGSPLGTAPARERALPSQNRKVVEATVPARNEEFGFVPARRSKRSLQKSVGGIWPRISSAYALQKERSGSSERGPSRGERRR